LAHIRLVVFPEKRKLKLRKMTSPSRRLGYSNKQLKSCLQVKGQFQAFGNHGLVTSIFGIKACVFCVFLENDSTDLRQIFFRV